MTKITDRIFEAMNALADARHIFAREPPKHSLTQEQKNRIKTQLEKAKKAIAALEKLVSSKH